MLDSDASVCLSGGALGADAAWGDAARLAGHDVIHWVFAGHSNKAGVPIKERHVLSQQELLVADDALVMANRRLDRRWPIQNQHVANLLRRNYYQVQWSDACYAISTFEKGQVKGGTAWATTMFTNRFEGPCPCYVYDQVRRTWTVWDGEGFLEADEVPAPSGTYAGIGTRELNQHGSRAILDLYGFDHLT